VCRTGPPNYQLWFMTCTREEEDRITYRHVPQDRLWMESSLHWLRPCGPFAVTPTARLRTVIISVQTWTDSSNSYSNEQKICVKIHDVFVAKMIFLQLLLLQFRRIQPPVQGQFILPKLSDQWGVSRSYILKSEFCFRHRNRITTYVSTETKCVMIQ